MRDPDNVQALYEYKPDYIGLIYYPESPRCILSNESFPCIPHSHHTQKIGVFVNESPEWVNKQVERYGLSLVQLHGKESPEYCAELTDKGIKVIKAFSIGKEDFDFSQLEVYEPFCAFFLFDTKGKLPGGNGYTFRWDMLNDYGSEVPFFLSGGISLDDLDRLENLLEKGLNIHGIDVNSQFEKYPAYKDMDKIRELAAWIEIIYRNS
jgi:phosphoribosylanthranilate isomerase